MGNNADVRATADPTAAAASPSMGVEPLRCSTTVAAAAVSNFSLCNQAMCPCCMFSTTHKQHARTTKRERTAAARTSSSCASASCGRQWRASCGGCHVRYLQACSRRDQGRNDTTTISKPKMTAAAAALVSPAGRRLWRQQQQQIECPRVCRALQRRCC